MLKNLRKKSESGTVDLGNVKIHTKSHTAVPLFVNLDDNYQPHPAGQGSPHKYSILFYMASATIILVIVFCVLIQYHWFVLNDTIQ
jgi:hypothetical protein